MNIGQKILLGIGILGLALLTPVIFYTFGNSGPVDFLGDKIGALGSPSTLTFISFCMIGLMAILGGGKNGSATVISLIIGCLLISTAVDISFMMWFKDLMSNIEPLSNHKLNLLTGVFILLFGMFLSFAKKISLKVEVLALVILPISFLVGSSYAGILPVGENGDNFNISMNEGFSSLKGMIKEKYMKQENVQNYVSEIEEDESLTEEEKVVIDQLDTEDQWTVIRGERFSRLTGTDWTQLADAPLTSQEVADYSAYRQELRDIPQNQSDPFNITWPVAP